MPAWVDFKTAFWARLGDLAAGLVVGLILIGAAAGLALWLGPELASRFSSLQ